ncbi:MAG TPA: hypothetical protein VIL46_17935 [Gemmataceae bacterium]
MTTTLQSRPVRTTAAEVCRLFKLSPLGATLLKPEHAAPEFFDLLVEAGLYADARRLLAHALPPRRAVWWAGLCLTDSARQKPLAEAAERDALDAAVRWAAQPCEATRRAAEKAGWAARPTTAAGNLAMAAFLSGGSISRPGLPAVLPKPHLCGRLCGVAVYLASVRFDPARYKDHLRDYLAVGREVAQGKNLPPDLPPLPDPDPVPAPGTAAFPHLAELMSRYLGGQWGNQMSAAAGGALPESEATHE